jgi:hypothetical protein
MFLAKTACGGSMMLAIHRTGDIRQDRTVVEVREAVEQTQKPLRAPRWREETQERLEKSIVSDCRRSTVRRDHAPVQLRPPPSLYEITPDVEN